MGFDEEHDVEFRLLLSKCLMLAKEPLQVVKLGGPDVLNVYAEYGPYAFYDNEYDLIKICMPGVCPGTVNPFLEDTPYPDETARVGKRIKTSGGCFDKVYSYDKVTDL